MIQKPPNEGLDLCNKTPGDVLRKEWAGFGDFGLEVECWDEGRSLIPLNTPQEEKQ